MTLNMRIGPLQTVRKGISENRRHDDEDARRRSVDNQAQELAFELSVWGGVGNAVLPNSTHSVDVWYRNTIHPHYVTFQTT